MKTTLEWLDAIKAKTGATSDYQISKIMTISRAQVSNYRRSGETFSDETCFKVASILEIDPILVISSVHAEKAKNDFTKSAWKTVFERLGGVAASVLIASALLVSPTETKACDKEFPSNVYYVKSRKRKKIPNPLAFLVAQIIQA